MVVATYNLLFNASLLVAEGLGYAIGLDKIINTGENSLSMLSSSGTNYRSRNVHHLEKVSGFLKGS